MAELHRGIQNLPQEVFRIVLDHLGHNKALLRNCSLVCRSWLQASRPRLFATVSLYACENRLVEFLSFLDTHPDITNHVRSLTLHKPMDDQQRGLNTPLNASVTVRTVVRTARRLPRLREYHLYFVHVVSPVQDRVPIAPDAKHDQSPTELGTFHVYSSAYQEIGPFLELLAQFHVDRLDLEHVTFIPGSNGPDAHPTPPGCVHVRELRWTDRETVDESSVAILSALTPALSTGSLQVLQCTWHEWTKCASVGAFLRASGDTLTHLTLDMSVQAWVEERGSASQYRRIRPGNAPR
ncbi:hypothetical protein C8Q77DRAFT_183447 [Trametes polyzona]|nr:hypothetical protein C8Q77DRAFT_183447 [Trametes polyzona]